MKRTILNGAAIAAISIGIAAAAGGAARADEAACAAMTGAMLEQTEITSATWYPASDRLPANCEVVGVIRPVEGSEIGVVYRLPDGWNGRVLGIGGGGWLGNTRLEPEGASVGLTRGYATMQTDGGHPIDASVFDATSWAINEDGSLNEVKVEDFSHRAIHLMTVRGKEVAEQYYGRPHERAYYQGCSTGGRMGLMEAQRYPDDFDGIIAGAPVYTFQTQTSAILRTNAFAAEGARLQTPHLALINSAVLAACDADDGAEDGILRDPRMCDFDPSELQCTEGQAAETCLSAAQVNAVRRVYEGERMAGGAIASYPLEKGSEAGWVNFVPATAEGDWGTNSGGLNAFRGAVLGDPEFDMSTFDADDVATVRSSWMAGVYEAADPDIADYVANGGKLILWHGVSDPGPNMRGTLEYYEAAMEATPGAEDSVRLFLAPGVGHCRGGEGPDTVDWLGALEAWVEQGAAPQELPATKANSDLAWNLCPYPQLPTGQADGTYSCE